MRSQIHKDQREVDNAEGLTSEYKALEADIEEKESRIQRVSNDIRSAKYEERINEQTILRQELVVRSEALQAENEELSKQAGERTALEMKREELKRKETDLKNSLAVNNPKFRKLVGTDAKAETMERDVIRTHA